MAFCTNCGNEIKDGDHFCRKCGSKITVLQTHNSAERQVSYGGKVQKCPNCGAVLKSFVGNCPECGYELRGAAKTESVNEFSLRYAEAKTNSQKIDLIRTYAIPNTKEDILEFFILASSNIDEDSFTKSQTSPSDGVTQQEVSDAWMAKFEQAYQKASFLLEGKPELQKIEKLYQKKKSALNSDKAKSIKGKAAKEVSSLFTVLISILIIIAVIWIPIRLLKNAEKKLENQVNQIESYISEENYDAALTVAYAMSDDYSENWSQTRANLISRIEKLRADKLGTAKIPEIDFEDMTYSEAVSAFDEAGFINVKAEALDNLIDRIFHSDGVVKEVEINGQLEYTKGTYVPNDVPVIIRYYSS